MLITKPVIGSFAKFYSPVDASWYKTIFIRNFIIQISLAISVTQIYEAV